MDASEESTFRKAEEPGLLRAVRELRVGFEVKEFDGPFLDSGRIDPNPHGPISEKINVARKQFREYKDRSCSLVLVNPKAATAGINDRLTMIGAMLGNPGFQFQLGSDSSLRESVS